MGCARNNDMQVRIDHRTGSVHFGTDLSEAQRTDLPEGPHIQSMPSEQVRTQLMSMMSVLDKSLATIHPDRNKVENAELRQRITEALYNFWLYELCDVYLEYLKPIFQGTDSSAILTARNVLYTCLDGGLRLISPFMPYISEELFQRLPRWSAKEPPSIMVTPFPTSTNTPYRDTAVEAEVELVQKIVGVVRSTRADYNIPNKTKTQLFLKVFCPDTSSIVKKFTSTVATLAYSKQVEVVDSPPSGCAIVTVNDKITAHLVLKGLVDPVKEIEKLTKKRMVLQQTLEKLLKAVKVPDYLTKVPEDIRKANQEKIEQSEVEIARLGDAMAALANIEA